MRELSGGGYFCSVPLVLLAFFGRDARLIWLSAIGLALPIVADATLGIFLRWTAIDLCAAFRCPACSQGRSFAPATHVRRDRCHAIYCVRCCRIIALQPRFGRIDSTPARYLADPADPARIYGPADQLPYLQIYAPELRQCDLASNPAEVLYVTTRYSPPAQPPKGYQRCIELASA